VLGRLGVALAEADRTDEAIAWHRQAVELAQLHKLPELQGDQLIMLAFAHLEQQRHDEARAFCEQALDVFTAAGLDARAASVRDLLAQLDEPA
jgi:tetratricopeptide (TPR) repeat protein